MAERKIRVLIVEDDPELIALLEHTLRLAGYDIFTAQNGEVALTQFAAVSPEVMLLDLMMPGMDGFTVLENIRAHSDIPVIVLTALSGNEAVEKSFLLGADDYIVKPYRPKDVLARIEKVLPQLPPPVDSSTYIQAGSFTLDIETGVLTKEQQLINLAQAETRLLKHCLSFPHTPITYEKVFEVGWGRPPLLTDPVVNLANLAVQRLRDKIEDDPSHPAHLQNLKGIGFTFNP